MRVIAGRWKGRRLLAPTGREIRPTTDRVKEALFSLLGADLVGAQVADLCCGAGGLGIEALSRGARLVTFIDSEASALKLVTRNLEVCGCEQSRFRIARRDAVAWVRNLSRQRIEHPLFILADPPYHSTVAQQLLMEILELPGDVPLATMVLEHGPDTELIIPDTCTYRVDQRNYGQSGLMILSGQAGGDDE